MPLSKLNERSLTTKQERFCHEYTIDWNATAAYLRAGYKASYRKIATQNAAKLLAIEKVQSRIKSLQGVLNEKSLIQATTVIKELARIGLANIKHLTQYDPVSKLFFVPDLRDLTDDVTAAIKKIRTAWVLVEVSPGKWKNKQVFVLELHDKIKALELAGKYLGIFDDDKDKGINISFNYNTQKPVKDASAGVSAFADGGIDSEDVEAEEVETVQPDPGDQANINEVKKLDR